MGKLVVLDISESGKLIGEKLHLLLSPAQEQELAQYIAKKTEKNNSTISLITTPPIQHGQEQQLTEIHVGDLYFCLENRVVRIEKKELDLTAKEFDILALLIGNPERVFTYEVIMDVVWNEPLDCFSRKAINNHISNLRKKLKATPQTPDYIKSVHCVGYKFNISGF